MLFSGKPLVISLFYIIFFVSVVLMLGYLVLVIRRFVLAHKKADSQGITLEEDIDSLEVTPEEIYPPLNPRYFSWVCAAFFVFAFSGSMLFMYNSGISHEASFVISLLLGIAGGVLGALIDYAVELQTNDQALFIINAIGLSGMVIKDIPAKRSGNGKVRMSMHGKITEFNSATYDEVSLPRGTPVKVVNTISDDTVIVERIK